MALRANGRDARGRTIWIVDYRPRGQGGPRLRTRFVGSRREAECFLADRLAERVNSRAGAPPPGWNVRRSIEDYLSALGQDRRHGYVRNVTRTLAAVAAALGTRPVDAVTRRWLDDYRRTRTRAVSARTVNRELGEIRAWLAEELRAGRLASNPAATLRPLRFDAKEVGMVWPADYGRAWERVSEPVRDAMDALVVTGMRLGELQMLAPERVQPGRLRLEGRKARDVHYVTVPPGLERALRARLAALYWPKLTRLTHYLRRASAPRRFGAHALRHTCACWLLAQGVGIYQVKDRLGHSSVTVTERYGRMVAGFDWPEHRASLPPRTLGWVEQAASRLRPMSLLPPAADTSRSGMVPVAQPAGEHADRP